VSNALAKSSLRMITSCFACLHWWIYIHKLKLNNLG
jgi:hypothetical protein